MTGADRDALTDTADGAAHAAAVLRSLLRVDAQAAAADPLAWHELQSFVLGEVSDRLAQYGEALDRVAQIRRPARGEE